MSYINQLASRKSSMPSVSLVQSIHNSHFNKGLLDRVQFSEDDMQDYRANRMEKKMEKQCP